MRCAIVTVVAHRRSILADSDVSVTVYFRSLRTKIMVPFVLWLVLLLLSMMAVTLGVFRYQEEQRLDQLSQVPQAFFESDFANYIDRIKTVTGADVVVFDNADEVIDATLPDIPSQQMAACVRVVQARAVLFQDEQPYVAWNVRCDGVSYKAVHYPLDATGRIWTYLLNRTGSLQAQRRLMVLLAAISVGGALLGALLSHLVSRTVTKPVGELVDATCKVADGDLTQRIQARTQDEIGTLAASFDQMTEQLLESREALIEAERFSTAGRMSAAFAHEVRNPLSSIRMLIQLLQKRLPTDSERYARAILEEVDRLNVIVDGMLDFARPAEPEFETTDICQVVRDVLQFMDANLKHHQIEVKQQMASVSLIQADPGKLKQVFMNLVLNAMEAMPDGGTLAVEVGQAAGAIKVRFHDNGVGMTPEQQQQLFVPFYTTKERGTGLGLTNALRIVEQHSGSIEVTGQVGRGTTVLVKLQQNQQENGVTE